MRYLNFLKVAPPFVSCRNLTGLRPYDNVRDLITPRISGSQLTQPKITTFDEAVQCVKSGKFLN